ncbi:MAG: AlpA family phage regulatory protein [Pseudomonadota bacterium]
MSDKSVQADLFDTISGPAALHRPVAKQPSYEPKPRRPSRNEADEAFLSVDQIMRRYSIARATVWRWVKANSDFPEPVKLSRGTSRWRLSDLVAFDRARENGSVRKKRSVSERSTKILKKRCTS